MTEPSYVGAADRYFQHFDRLPDQGGPRVQAGLLYDTRITNREPATSHAWLDGITRRRMLELGHVDNPMYLRLLAGELDEDQWDRFLSEYYWGSGYGFQRVVLKEALSAGFGERWKDYIQSIIREECKPSPHYRMFTDFIAACGFTVRPQGTASRDFIAAQVVGYRKEACFSWGYAMGIEFEADFQISLLAVALRERFAAALASTPFFDIHMDREGEQLHAELTLNGIAKVCRSPEDERQVDAGFSQAILDTGAFMEAILRTLCTDMGLE